MKTNIQQLVEKAIREHVRSLLNEGLVVPVALEQGTSFYNNLKKSSVDGDTKSLLNSVRLAIRSLKNGDRADQKFADNLRAYQASVKSKTHPDWRIVELGFAEWVNRRKINPVVVTNESTKPSSEHDHKKTELERIYENLESFARRNNVNVFEVLDNMMVVAEKEVSLDPTSIPEIALDPSFQPNNEFPGDWGFEHNGVKVTNPLYDPAGKTEVNPCEFYGDSFLNSKFPFQHGDMMIVDPRYNETGDLEVDPESHYGDAYRSSDYFKVLNKKLS